MHAVRYPDRAAVDVSGIAAGLAVRGKSGKPRLLELVFGDQYLESILRLMYSASFDFPDSRSYDLPNVEVTEFTLNRCPIQ